MLLSALAMATTANPITLTQPDFDRWMYPYNATPGFRSAAPTFSAYGAGPFDDRDGQALYGWITGDVIDAGWPAHAYAINQCRVTVTLLNDNVIYDPSPDDPATHEPDGPADADPGRPTVLSAAGFRNDFDGWSFGEDGPFGVPSIGTRNCFAADFDDTGTLRDISNSLSDGFVPNTFAIAQTDAAQPGELIPVYTEMTFEIDVTDPDIQCYIKNGLADGLVEFIVSSYHYGTHDGGSYPNWVLKENSLVDLGLINGAQIMLDVALTEPSGVPGDIDGDGLVAVDDLLELLGDYGRCPCCASDLDGNGLVDVDDLLGLIGNWS